MSLEAYLVEGDRNLNQGANSTGAFPSITAPRPESPARLQSYFVVAVNGADDSREGLYAR